MKKARRYVKHSGREGMRLIHVIYRNAREGTRNGIYKRMLFVQYVTEHIGYWDQKIQPFYFGDPAVKTTCLWLKNLPKLNGLVEVAENPKAFKPKPMGYTKKGTPYYFSDSVSKKYQAKIRSKTFPGIARAMAEQWG